MHLLLLFIIVIVVHKLKGNIYNHVFYNHVKCSLNLSYWLIILKGHDMDFLF